MSETTIVSLLNKRDGRVISSIVPMKNGKWLEIKKQYKFQSKKEVFDSEESWLSARNNEGWYEIERNRREPYKSKEERWQETSIPSCYKDAYYLSMVQFKYGIKFNQPLPKPNLGNQKALIENAILYYQDKLNQTYPAETLQPYQELLEKEKENLVAVEFKLKTKGSPSAMEEFYPLTREKTLAYVKAKDKLLPISYCEGNGKLKIVFEGKAAETFAEFDLPERPELWIKVRGNKFISAF